MTHGARFSGARFSFMLVSSAQIKTGVPFMVYKDAANGRIFFKSSTFFWMQR
jgi:hypothetical protein